MGFYLNPDNMGFWKAVRSEIYIDKTGLIQYTNKCINTEQQYICVSRPRRFGKSMALKMLAAYYSCDCDSRDLFRGFAIERAESFAQHLNQYDVICLNMQQFLIEASDGKIMEYLEQEVVAELNGKYEEILKGHGMGLAAALRKIYVKTGNQFVFLIDEWDCVMRERQQSEELQKKYLDFLRNLLKDQPYVALAYMTGILPVKKYGEHSAINMFKEFSMLNPGKIAEYFGFTAPEVEMLCKHYHVDFAEAQKWYDGYLIGEYHIYNPQSIVELMDSGEFQSYWTGTETYEALKVYIDRNFDGLKEAIIAMLGNGHCKIDPSTFQNDMTTFKAKDDVLTLLVHLGYLTYDKKNSEVFIPNQEIAMEFMRAVKMGGWDGLMQALTHSEKLLSSTWEQDGAAVAKGISVIHSETASLLKYNDENSLTCTVLMAYYSAKAYYMNPLMELPSGKGFADVVYLPKRNVDKPALVVELKWDKSARGAIRQIKEKQYTAWIEGYVGEIFLIGITYHKGKKTHECVIEKYVKE